MGIRISLCVGYGLDITGMNTDKLNDYEFLENTEIFKQYIEEIAANDISHEYSLVKYLIESQKINSFYELITYDSEFGYDDKLLMYPIGFKKEWRRYGDTLDCFNYEANNDPKDWMSLSWKEKKGTLYPYTGLMKHNADLPLGIEVYWESCYLDKEEFKSAVPYAPIHLWFLIKYLELVPENEITNTFLKLKPTVYTYWS